ncbi:MAG: DUF115 domain-containing protein [Acholeplasma sp.]|nr:DUF115 domain-containing protein [Acholeplasma sp.]
MLADNIVLLRKRFPLVYECINKYEENCEGSNFIHENSKSDIMTLKYLDQRMTVYVHSKYNPIREAETIINNLLGKESITNETHILFYGVGLGYHIIYFAKKFPNVRFSLIDPSIEAMQLLLDSVALKSLGDSRIVNIQVGDHLADFFNNIIERRDQNVVICELPAYKKIFEEDYSSFLTQFKSMIKEQKISLNVNSAFQKRWIINSINNFKEVLQTPNILMESNEIFKEKTAVLVSAGPSLNFEIENLRKIKDEGLAYIFSVGSAINTLIHNSIHPHAMCTYDPMEENQLAFKKVNELKIESIPMIFGTSVGYETLQQYQGPKFHMITNQDTVSDYFLKTLTNQEIVKVHDAPSIAVVTLELMVKLGFSRIILVGQNLAYLNERHYSEGVPYEVGKVKEILLTENVDGKQIETNESFMVMKRLLEQNISNLNANVVNTTVNGAKIEGTTFIPLEVLMRELQKNSVNMEEPFEQIIQTKMYDQKYISEQFDKLEKSYDNYKFLISDIKDHISQLKGFVTMNSTKRINEVHKNMDQLIGCLENNIFFTVFTLPLHRVEYGILAQEIKQIKLSCNQDKTIKKIIKPTENFINLLSTNIALNEVIMDVLNNTIKLKKAIL